MLPLRLGTVNANGPQELFVYALTRKGPGRDHQLPHGEAALGHGSAGLTSRIAASSRGSTRRCSRGRSRSTTAASVFTEYAWDMGWCDPCASDPLSNDELRNLGRVLAGRRGAAAGPGVPHAAARPLRRRAFPGGPGVPGNRRPRQLPGPLRPAPCVGRDGHRATAPKPIACSVRQRQEQEAQQLASPDRLANRRHPGEDGARRQAAGPAGLVAAIWKNSDTARRWQIGRGIVRRCSSHLCP